MQLNYTNSLGGLYDAETLAIFIAVGVGPYSLDDCIGQ